MAALQAIDELHARCSVYTSKAVSARLLDLTGWSSRHDLTTACLLEPCVGEGAILVEAIRRLLKSFSRYGGSISQQSLMKRICGFELHSATAAIARSNVTEILEAEGLKPEVARALAEQWVQTGDFLLTDVGQATHVAANPPYVRWSRVPVALATNYRKLLAPEVTRGDLSVAFLDRMLDWAEQSGVVAALVSDRWMYTQYGDVFQERLAERGWAVELVDERPADAFVRKVGAYASIVRLTKSKAGKPYRSSTTNSRLAPRRLYDELLDRYGDLASAGCIVRVGPALGCGRTFIVDARSAEAVEPELVRPYVDREDIHGTKVNPGPFQVIVPFDRNGRLVRLEEWPRFQAWAAQHKLSLQKRKFVLDGAPWWRTIDTIGPQWLEQPKLLVPELCKEPMVALDRTPSIPAHSVYAIWSSEWPIIPLQRVLNAGLLKLTAEAQAPMLQKGWYRFYKRFILRTPLPSWSKLTDLQRRGLSSKSSSEFFAMFAALFGEDLLALPTGPGDSSNGKDTRP